MEKAVGSAPRHVVEHARFCSRREAKAVTWPALRREGTSPSSAPPHCLLPGSVAEGPRPADSHHPHGNAKCRVQLVLREFKDDFEGGGIKQGFGIAVEGVSLRGGI